MKGLKGHEFSFSAFSRKNEFINKVKVVEFIFSEEIK